MSNSTVSNSPEISTKKDSDIVVATQTIVLETLKVEEKADDNADGNAVSITRSHHDKERFRNIWPGWSIMSMGTALKWGLTRPKMKLPPQIDLCMPVIQKPAIVHPHSAAPSRAVQVTWIGHATVLVQMEGLTLLTDPIFSKRCSPFQCIGPSRIRPVPCEVSQLPHVDIVVISHNHYDHLDKNTVKQLHKRFGAQLQWFVPLRLDAWFRDNGVSNVIALDWWETTTVTAKPSFRVSATPAQHWSGRFPPRDRNKTLWSSWCVFGPNTSFYFAGDTGYCETFKEIGQKYGPFTLAAIPIGAYSPRELMCPQHIDPEEAVLIHKDIGAEHSIGVHWGTFHLTDEPWLEPPVRLAEAAQKHGLTPNEFFVLRHGGECTVLGKQRSPQQQPAAADEPQQ